METLPLIGASPAVACLLRGAVHLPAPDVELISGDNRCRLLGGAVASSAGIMVACGCSRCAEVPMEQFPRGESRICNLGTWMSTHAASRGAGHAFLAIRQEGAEAPLGAWLRAAAHHMGGAGLVRKQLSIFWWDIESDGPGPTVPPPPSQRAAGQAAGIKPPAGAWRAATVVGFDPASGVHTLKYHSDPKRQTSQVLLPLAQVHFARMPPQPGTAPRNVMEGRTPLPPLTTLMQQQQQHHHHHHHELGGGMEDAPPLMTFQPGALGAAPGATSAMPPLDSATTQQLWLPSPPVIRGLGPGGGLLPAAPAAMTSGGAGSAAGFVGVGVGVGVGGLGAPQAVTHPVLVREMQEMQRQRQMMQYHQQQQQQQQQQHQHQQQQQQQQVQVEVHIQQLPQLQLPGLLLPAAAPLLLLPQQVEPHAAAAAAAAAAAGGGGYTSGSAAHENALFAGAGFQQQHPRALQQQQQQQQQQQLTRQYAPATVFMSSTASGLSDGALLDLIMQDTLDVEAAQAAAAAAAAAAAVGTEGGGGVMPAGLVLRRSASAAADLRSLVPAAAAAVGPPATAAAAAGAATTLGGVKRGASPSAPGCTGALLPPLQPDPQLQQPLPLPPPPPQQQQQHQHQQQYSCLMPAPAPPLLPARAGSGVAAHPLPSGMSSAVPSSQAGCVSQSSFGAALLPADVMGGGGGAGTTGTTAGTTCEGADNPIQVLSVCGLLASRTTSTAAALPPTPRPTAGYPTSAPTAAAAAAAGGASRGTPLLLCPTAAPPAVPSSCNAAAAQQLPLPLALSLTYPPAGQPGSGHAWGTPAHAPGVGLVPAAASAQAGITHGAIATAAANAPAEDFATLAAASASDPPQPISRASGGFNSSSSGSAGCAFAPATASGVLHSFCIGTSSSSGGCGTAAAAMMAGSAPSGSSSGHGIFTSARSLGVGTSLASVAEGAVVPQSDEDMVLEELWQALHAEPWSAAATAASPISNISTNSSLQGAGVTQQRPRSSCGINGMAAAAAAAASATAAAATAAAQQPSPVQQMRPCAALSTSLPAFICSGGGQPTSLASAAAATATATATAGVSGGMSYSLLLGGLGPGMGVGGLSSVPALAVASDGIGSLAGGGSSSGYRCGSSSGRRVSGGLVNDLVALRCAQLRQLGANRPQAAAATDSATAAATAVGGGAAHHTAAVLLHSSATNGGVISTGGGAANSPLSPLKRTARLSQPHLPLQHHQLAAVAAAAASEADAAACGSPLKRLKSELDSGLASAVFDSGSLVRHDEDSCCGFDAAAATGFDDWADLVRDARQLYLGTHGAAGGGKGGNGVDRNC